MKKRTHFALSRQLLKDNEHELGKIDSMLFCFGSIFPDMTPLCLLHPHKFNITERKSKKRMFRLLFEDRHHWADSFRLGCLSHHLADYFTAPHNRSGVMGFCMDHRGYEMRFDEYFKNKLKDYGIEKKVSSASTLGFWKYMQDQHEKYIENIGQKESFVTDYKYISDMISTLFVLTTQKQRAYKLAKANC